MGEKMQIYDKIKKYTEELTIQETIEKGRLVPFAYTRKGKIGFEKMAQFILNKRGMSLEMEIDNFKNIFGEKWEKVTKSAICQQRKYFNPIVFKDLHKKYIIRTYDNPEDYETYKGYLIFAIDGMDIELPNTEKIREEFGHSKGRTGQRTAARATTSSIYDVVNNMMIDSQIAKYNTSERELAKINIEEMLTSLGDQKKVIIFDRGYPSLELIHFLDVIGVKYLIRVGSKSYNKEINSMQTNDEIVGIKITKSRLRRVKATADRVALEVAKEVKSRFVKYQLDTGETEVLLTNLEAEEFNTEEIGELYYKRWKIELAYDIAKNKLSIENISGQSRIVVEQEFYAQMFLLNIAEDIRKEANRKVRKTKEKGYKYDYKPNMNILIGKLRERFILLSISICLNNDEESHRMYNELIDEISKSVVPIRENRKNSREKYKGYNKHKQNLRRNS